MTEHTAIIKKAKARYLPQPSEWGSSSMTRRTQDVLRAIAYSTVHGSRQCGGRGMDGSSEIEAAWIGLGM
jgi:hypothetical protein